MKIVNTEQGQAYHLTPGTELECERTNPFFNERGEQSLPVSLPDTDHNRKLLLYPEQLQRKAKAPKRIAATIEDGDFYMPCRQAILGAQRNAEISTSFYMNEGAFYSKLSDITLAMVFGEETIPGVDTVQKGIDFCTGLMKGTDPNFAIFPVWVDEKEIKAPDPSKDVFYQYIGINRYSVDGTTITLRNAVATTMDVGDKKVSIPAGFYISPFIRGNYLLKRVFAYLGYTLSDNFFTRTKPFPDMVFVNNCIDSLINGTIKLVDLVPECTCAELLEFYRKKFCLEFIPNECDNTMDIVLFNDAIEATPSCDISSCITSQFKIEYPDLYSQISLKPKESVDKNSGNDPASYREFKSKYPTAQYNSITNSFYREVYYGRATGTGIDTTIESIPAPQTYCIGDEFNIEDIIIPECVPHLKEWWEYNMLLPKDAPSLYIGDSISKHSMIVYNDKSKEDFSENKQPIIVAFASIYNSLPCGSYDSKIGIPGNKYIDYLDFSLLNHGSKGIFNRFYKKLDVLKRNSLHKINVELLLNKTDKKKLVSHIPVIINGQRLLINNLKYSIGGMNKPRESMFYTTKLYDTIVYSPSLTDLFPTASSNYHWREFKIEKMITKEEFDDSPYKGIEFSPIYPPHASIEYADNNIHFSQILLKEVNGTYYQITLGLTATKYFI